MPRRSSTPTDKPAKKKANRCAPPSGLKENGFYRRSDLVKPYGLTPYAKTTLDEKERAGLFPARVRLGGVVAWSVPAVNAWLAEHGALPVASGAKEARHG